ncbi:DUF1028 domain-containing protein [Paenarthrobacter sp. Z7-10]|uniref:DUF1028 domain-containing protein n=1 Tax=Paenarthrobacter sp. Z7-10 TaxID=2787635 RepID=UPI0022A9D78A|nr:DUF1028 domain-containing protein [Paenarthrobacter sp. Z7-10]MCZ2404471.1 DUF1028 domain-containing protein [Paenarthrobacter sp. Z7-10]
MTFSIAARCPQSGMVGVAVSTAVPAVGAICAFGAPGFGAIATQSWVNPYLGIDGVEMLRQGMKAAEVLEQLISQDPGRDVRQVGIVDGYGNTAAYSGSACTAWFGDITGPGYSIQGNMLTGGETLEAMKENFESSGTEDLPERLLQALEAGQSAGGDKRGRQSAALKVYSIEEYPYLDLRVDEHSDPVPELRRVFEVAQRQLVPFITMMPTRHDTIGGHDEAVEKFILLSPEERARRS